MKHYHRDMAECTMNNQE